MGAFLFGLVVGAGLAWAFMRRRNGYWREFNARRRGSNPPPPCRKPAPPAGPPDCRRSFTHENFNQPGGPLPLKFRRSEPDPPEQFIRMDEGTIQRGNGNGGPSTPKPSLKPQPSGGYQIRNGQLWGGYQPRPQSGTPNPPEAP